MSAVAAVTTVLLVAGVLSGVVLRMRRVHVGDYTPRGYPDPPFETLASSLLRGRETQGRVDVSPKGDPAGKVAHVIDDHRIAIPERPGNKRVDGYLNILQNPHVGTIAVIPGRGDTLRINGTARIVTDADYFDALAVLGKRPILAIEIEVEETFFHCAKAFLRSDLWKPETWDPSSLPSVAQITKRLMPEVDLAALEDRYEEGNYRKLLY